MLLPLRYGNGSLATRTVLSESELASQKNTVCDPELELSGALIKLPISCTNYVEQSVREVWFPPDPSLREDGQIILGHVQSAAQMLLCAIDRFKNSKISENQMARSFTGYQKQIIRALFGKDGYINRHILSTRMRRSARGVLLPSEGGSPFWCGVPFSIMNQLSLEDGDYVVVGRDPTIWEGSLEVLRADGVTGDAIRLHPLVYSQLGADNDGDTVWLVAVPNRHRGEAAKHLGQFMKRNATYPVPYTSEGEKIYWETVEEDLYERASPDGFSVSPRDIMDDTDVMETVEEITGKELREDCQSIASGISLEGWKKIVLHMNQAQMTMKVGMGPVGAAGIALRIIAGDHLRRKRSAGIVSERLQQKLLSAKNAKDVGCEYSYIHALDVLQKRNNATGISAETATRELSRLLGLSEPDVKPIVETLWSYDQSLSGLIRQQYPFYAATTRSAETDDISMMLAISIFHFRELDPNGIARFIIEALNECVKEEPIAVSEGV